MRYHFKNTLYINELKKTTTDTEHEYDLSESLDIFVVDEKGNYVSQKRMDPLSIAWVKKSFPDRMI